MPDQAVEANLKARALFGSAPETIAALKQAYAAFGLRGFRQKEIELDLERSKRAYVSPYNIAVLYTGLGDKQTAFEWLNKAYEERASWMIYLKVDPALDSLRSDPRFPDLVRKVGLPP